VKDGRFTVYRGLGLPEEAIETYKTFHEKNEEFEFSGFTSTSLIQKEALKFAAKYGLVEGKVPVLLNTSQA